MSLSQIANTDKNCSFRLLKHHFHNSGYGFAVHKNSPWLREISLSVLTHQENGTVQSIVNRWFPKSVYSTDEHRKLESSDFHYPFLDCRRSQCILFAVFIRRNVYFVCIGKVWPEARAFGAIFKTILVECEGDHFLVQYQSAPMATRCDVTERQMSYDNNGSDEICELERKIALRSIHHNRHTLYIMFMIMQFLGFKLN